MLWPWLLALIAFLAPASEGARNNLSCYQCHVEDNSLCTRDDLKPCGDEQAYDVCMTLVRRTVAEGYEIIKRCALDRCTMDPAQSVSLGLNDCDRSKKEFECVSCCRESGCNTDAGLALPRPPLLPLLLLLLSASFVFIA